MTRPRAASPPRAMASCHADNDLNYPQWGPGVQWSCCSTGSVYGIEFKTEVPNSGSFYDPVDWVVTDYASPGTYGTSGTYELTRCNVTLASNTAYNACVGNACVGSSKYKCSSNFQAPSAPRRLCLRGTCGLPSGGLSNGNALCTSNVYLCFRTRSTSCGLGAASGGAENGSSGAFTENSAFRIVLPVLFVLLSIACHMFRIYHYRRRTGQQIPFFSTQSFRGLPAVPTSEPSAAPAAPQPPPASAPQPSPYEVHIPGRGGRRDTVVVFEHERSPRESPSMPPARPSAYQTPADAYYPNV